MAPSSTRIRRSSRAVSAAVASGRRADESDTGDPQWSDRAGWLGSRAPAPRRAVLELRRSGTSSHALISVQEVAPYICLVGHGTYAWWGTARAGWPGGADQQKRRGGQVTAAEGARIPAGRRDRRRLAGVIDPQSGASDLPKLTDPVVGVAFEGWNDAGDAATGAVEHLELIWDATPLAALDPEDYYDFQVNRPTVPLTGGG